MNKKLLLITSILALLSLAAMGIYVYADRQNASPGAPVIEFDGERAEFSTSADEAQLLRGVSAYDAEDGDVSASLMVEGISHMLGGKTAVVTYAAFDSRGHVAKAERTVYFTDYERPAIELSGPLVFKASSGLDLLSRLSAHDVFDGDISDKIKYSVIDGGYMLSDAGEYSVEFWVTSSKCDTTRLTLPVELCQKEPNSAGIELSQYLLRLNVGDEFRAADYVVGYNSDSERREGASGLSIKSEVDTKTPGTYVVTYRLGSESTGSHTRLIVIVE